MTTDVTPDNDLGRTLETALASPAAVLATARLPKVPEHFFEQVRVRYGAELMLEAYIEALFSPDSALHRTATDMPAALVEHAVAFTARFMARLQSVNTEGRWFCLSSHVLEPFRLVMAHLAYPEDVTRVHLGTRRGGPLGGGAIFWRGHPASEVQRHFKRHPPVPGELGPALKPLLDYLKQSENIDEDMTTCHYPTALAMVHQLTLDETRAPTRLLKGSLLQLLGDRRYCEDLAYPIGERGCLIDHVPTLMTVVRHYCRRYKGHTTDRELMFSALDELQVAIDRNHERLFMSGVVPSGARERTNAGPARRDEMDIL